MKISDEVIPSLTNIYNWIEVNNALELHERESYRKQILEVIEIVAEYKSYYE